MLVFENGKLTGWHASKKEAESFARERKAEGSVVSVRPGSQRDADAIWMAERIRAQHTGLLTRRQRA